MIQYIKASNPQQADVEEIMSRVDFCTSHQRTNAAKALEGIGMEYFIQTIDRQRAVANVSWNLRLPVIMREPGIKGFIKCTIKRIISKCLRWYIIDLVSQQISFNANVANYVNSVDDTFRVYIQHTEDVNETVIQQLLRNGDTDQLMASGEEIR